MRWGDFVWLRLYLAFFVVFILIGAFSKFDERLWLKDLAYFSFFTLMLLSLWLNVIYIISIAFWTQLNFWFIVLLQDGQRGVLLIDKLKGLTVIDLPLRLLRPIKRMILFKKVIMIIMALKMQTQRRLIHTLRIKMLVLFATLQPHRSLELESWRVRWRRIYEHIVTILPGRVFVINIVFVFLLTNMVIFNSK